MHYSEIESSVGRAKRKVWFLRNLQNRRNSVKLKSGASVEESDIDTSKVLDRELEVLESKKILLRAQYEEAVELDFRTSGLEFSTADLVGSR